VSTEQNTSSNTGLAGKTLGELKADAFEQDVAVNDRHQSFSMITLPSLRLGEIPPRPSPVPGLERIGK
jgi:hypothetical protein